MGRQAHITRLALGRSPYGLPLRDENGDFILGPRAHVNDALGYRQEFDDRGHPQNHSSLTAARRLRKAQNDVLAAVGVVVKKGEDRKSKWEKLDDDHKCDIISIENSRGEQLRTEDRVLGVVLPWYFVSLRRRLMTFEPYYLLPVTSLVAKEFRLPGLPYSCGGLPMYILSSFPQMFRYYCGDTNIENIVNYANPWQDTKRTSKTVPEVLMWLAATSAAFCIELPLAIHATLQSLQIIPASVIISWKSLLPFSTSSPISLPTVPDIITSQTLYTFAISLLQSPVCLYLMRDWLQQEVGYRLYSLLRQILIKPDRPDPISAKILDESESTDDTEISEIANPWHIVVSEPEKHRKYFGPRSFWGALRFAFPPIYYLLNTFSRRRIAHSRGNLSPELDRQMRAAAREGYRLALANFDTYPTPNERITSQLNVTYSVFRFANLIPDEELVDPIRWTYDTLERNIDYQNTETIDQRNRSNTADRVLLPTGSRDGISNNRRHDEVVNSVLTEAFQAMQVSDAVFIQASNGQAVISVQPEPDDPSRVAARDNVHTINAAQVPLEALLQGVSDRDPETQLIERREARLQQQRAQATAAVAASVRLDQLPPAPPTPTPGLSRAVSLTDPQVENSPPTSFRPLRRPTETDDSLAAISQTLRAEAENLQSPRPLSPVSPITERANLNRLQSIEPGGAISSLIATKHRLYRVTTLSNHVADSLAWHASALLTSLILWPFEAMYLRSVAHWALQNPAMGSVIDPWWAARLGFTVVGSPISVFGLGVWFGGAPDTGGRLRYVGNILLTLGVEGIIRGACWRVGVWMVKRCKDDYGWGRF